MIAFFLSRRVLANLLTLFLIVVGTMAFLSTRREIMPEFTFFTVLIQTPYPGASPAEVEELVTTVLEDEIRTVDGLDRIESHSVDNLSIIIVRLDDRLSEAEVDRVVVDLQQAVNRVRNLPAQAEVPVVREITLNEPIVMLAVAGGSLEARDQLADDLEDTIKNIPGMSKVDLMGDRAHEIWVEVDPHRLLAHTVTLQDIAGAIAASNVQLPGGAVVLHDEDVLVRTAGPLRTAQEVADVLVRGQEDGRLLRVRDVARVRDTFESAPNTSPPTSATSTPSAPGASASAIPARRPRPAWRGAAPAARGSTAKRGGATRSSGSSARSAGACRPAPSCTARSRRASGSAGTRPPTWRRCRSRTGASIQLPPRPLRPRRRPSLAPRRRPLRRPHAARRALPLRREQRGRGALAGAMR